MSLLGGMSCDQLCFNISGPTDPETLDPKLICPVFDVFCWWLPETTRKRLRFGVKHEVVSFL